MKLQEGKQYKGTFGWTLLIWIACSFLPYPNDPHEPVFLGLAVSIVVLVMVQGWSGVALDQQSRASVSRQKSPRTFYLTMAGELGTAALAVVWAY